MNRLSNGTKMSATPPSTPSAPTPPQPTTPKPSGPKPTVAVIDDRGPEAGIWLAYAESLSRSKP